MKKNFKRALSAALVVVMLFTAFPAAFAFGSKETDYTINAYITRYRIRSAMKLLQNCRYKVYEVAEMVGYKDITYFSTIFKKIAGVTPSEYQDRSQ